MIQEQVEPRYEPGVEYMYSPSRNQITQMQGLLLKMNAGRGDWCLLTVEEPDPAEVQRRSMLELRKLSYRAGMTEAELVKACQESPAEGKNLAREKARHALIAEQIPAAKKKAEAAGKIAYDQISWKEQMARDAKLGVKSGNVIDLSKPIPDEKEPSNPAGKLKA